MDIFNPHSKDAHQGTEIVAKKKMEYKFIGSSIKRKGQVLWALNHKTFKIYKVKMVRREAIKLDGKEFGQYRAIVKDGDPMLWALNERNAIRKFKKSVDKKYKDKIH